MTILHTPRYARPFDDEAGAPLPDALPLGELPRGGRVALVALNDDKTPTDFVIHVLETFVASPSHSSMDGHAGT